MRPETALFIERAVLLEKWNIADKSKALYENEIMGDAIKTANQLSFILPVKIESRKSGIDVKKDEKSVTFQTTENDLPYIVKNKIEDYGFDDIDEIPKSDWIYLNSSNLNSVYFDFETNELFIRFNSGEIYVYFHVPLTIYTELLDAPSHGKFHSNHIKYTFQYERLK